MYVDLSEIRRALNLFYLDRGQRFVLYLGGTANDDSTAAL